MRIAACQLNTGSDRKVNLDTARDLLGEAAAQGADLAVLPEYTDYLGLPDGAPEGEPADGEFGQFFAAAASELGMWILAGSFREQGPGDGRTYNTSLLFGRDGILAAR
jgi:predicted amidohydrolase